jgi:hypothetical protein
MQGATVMFENEDWLKNLSDTQVEKIMLPDPAERAMRLKLKERVEQLSLDIKDIQNMASKLNSSGKRPTAPYYKTGPQYFGEMAGDAHSTAESETTLPFNSPKPAHFRSQSSLSGLSSQHHDEVSVFSSNEVDFVPGPSNGAESPNTERSWGSKPPAYGSPAFNGRRPSSQSSGVPAYPSPSPSQREESLEPQKKRSNVFGKLSKKRK